LAPYVLLCILAALLAAGSATAAGPISAKRAQAEAVFAQVQALDVSLGQADERLNLANIQLTQVKQDQALNLHELKIAKANLTRSQTMVAERLVNLYTTPQTSTLEVILGAASLDDVLNGVDTANRVSSLDANVLSQVLTFKSAVKRHGMALAREHRVATHLVAQRASEQRSFQSQLGERRALLSSINGQIASLEAQEQARELAAANAARAQAFQTQASAQTAFSTNVSGAFGLAPTAAPEPGSPYSAVVGIAEQYLGTPYVWAGSAPGGFDCSGLVMYSFAQVGVSLPHSSYAMWNYGVPVSPDQLEPGDILFFDGLGHVGIYVGGGQFIDAPYTGVDVRIDNLAGSDFVGARRIL
jgi:cell wall-associated NlpC family hydrolase